MMKQATALTILGIVLIGLYMSVTMVPAGHVGITVLFGRVGDRELEPGLNLVLPLTRVIKISTRTQTYVMSSVRSEGRVKGNDAINLLTSDGVSIKLDVTVLYRIDRTKAADIYKEIGLEYHEKIIRPILRAAVRNISSNYNAQDIYTSKRKDIAEQAYRAVKETLIKRGLILEEVLMRNVILPNRIISAIEEKISAQQEAEKMQFVLQKEQREAERKKIEALGISEAQKIISSSLTEPYLTWYYVQTLKSVGTSPNSTFVIAPFDQQLIPMLNIKEK